MKDLLKNMIIGTYLEPLARKIYTAFSRDEELVSKPVVNDQNRLYDIQTLDVMKRVLQENSNCIDVGCHQGSFLKEMLHFAPQGTHFAFEPLPELYQGLLKSFEDVPNAHIFDCALSDAEGTASFQHVATNPGFSGLRQRKYERVEKIEEITVKTNLLA